MIASRTGLAVLAAIAVALAIAIVAAPAPQPESHALAPTLDVHSLRWTRGGTVETTITLPAKDDSTVDAVLVALRGARWHRRAGVSAAGTPHVVLSVNDGAIELAIGDSLPGVDQTWIVTRGSAYLVDGWVARALDPGKLALGDRFPFAGSTTSDTLMFDGLQLQGHPRARDGMIVDVARVQRLERAMDELEYVALAPCPPGTVFQRARSGDGCVPADRWQSILDQIAALRGPPADVVERRPLVAAPSHVTLPDGAELDLAKRPRLGDHDADPDRTAELVAALTAPAEPVPLPTTKPTGSIVAGGITLALYDHVLARRGEPIALEPTPEAFAAITRPSSAYADPQRWLEDPSAVTSITLDGTKHERGAVLGEWTAARDPALIEALAAAVANVRAPAGPAPAAIDHRVDVELAPPAGKRATHHLELGHITPAGCAGRADGTAVVFAPPLCLAVAAAATGGR